MMTNLSKTSFLIDLIFLSDASLGMGEGLAGWVDSELRHDADGCPYLTGRTLRGLLVEECSALLHSVQAIQPPGGIGPWYAAAQFLFGRPGSQAGDRSALHVGDACLPAPLRQAIRYAIHNKQVTPVEVLDSLSEVRRQTAMDALTGAPKDESLRSVRLLLRGVRLRAELHFSAQPAGLALPLLAACTLSLRRAGSGRNRGRGELSARLLNESGQDITLFEFDQIRAALPVPGGRL